MMTTIISAVVLTVLVAVCVFSSIMIKRQQRSTLAPALAVEAVEGSVGSQEKDKNPLVLWRIFNLRNGLHLQLCGIDRSGRHRFVSLEKQKGRNGTTAWPRKSFRRTEANAKALVKSLLQ